MFICRTRSALPGEISSLRGWFGLKVLFRARWARLAGVVGVDESCGKGRAGEKGTRGAVKGGAE